MNADEDVTGPAPEPLPAFRLAVVGDAGGFTTRQVWDVLDLAVCRKLGSRSIALVGGWGCPGAKWAIGRGYGFIFVASFPSLLGRRGEVMRDEEIIKWAHALVVFGNPDRQRRILSLARRAKLPYHLARRP